MNVIRKRQILFTLVLAAASATARPAEPNDPNLGLKFRFIPGKVAWKMGDRTGDTPMIRPSYMAEVRIWWLFAEPNVPEASDLLDTEAGGSMSELQKQFIKNECAFIRIDSSAINRYKSFLGGQLTRGRRLYQVYGVSEKDARKMALALVEDLFKKAESRGQPLMDKHIDSLLEAQRELEQNIPDVEQRIEDFMTGVLGQAYSRYSVALKRSAYSLYPVEDAHKEVRKTIFELDKMIDVVEVEIAGLRAKISEIERYSRQGDVRNSPALAAKLKEMAIQESVELIGAETRHRAIVERKRAQENLYDLYEGWTEAGERRAKLQADLAKHKERRASIKGELGNIGQPRRAVIIERNEVKIHPVRLDADAEGTAGRRP